MPRSTAPRTRVRRAGDLSANFGGRRKRDGKDDSPTIRTVNMTNPCIAVSESSRLQSTRPASRPHRVRSAGSQRLLTAFPVLAPVDSSGELLL